MLIEKDGKTYAVAFKLEKHGHKWHTPNDFSIQIGTFQSDGVQEFKKHEHYHRLLETNTGIETLIVLHGTLDIVIYTSDNVPIYSILIKEKCGIMLLKGKHKITTSSKVEFVEIKTGKYISQAEDKFYD